MKYFHDVFTTLFLFLSLISHALLSMESIYDQGMFGLDVGIQCFDPSDSEFKNRFMIKQTSMGYFFGVYDRFGEGDVSAYLVKNLHTMINASVDKSMQDIFDNCFMSADQEVKNLQGGSRVAIAIMTGKTIHVAHCGDVRIIISQKLNNNELNNNDMKIVSTFDHRPGDDGGYAKKGENERIQKAEGHCYMVKGEILLDKKFPMSRAIGCYPKPNGLIADPGSCKYVIDDSYHHMILISHGVCKVLGNKTIVKLVQGTFRLGGNAQKAAQVLVNKALKLKHGFQGDLTALVVRFIWKTDIKSQYK